LKSKQTGENVVIIGGGLSGCEIAYELSLEGKNPIIIEAQDDLMKARGLCLANSSYLKDYFEYKKVPVYLESSVVEIKKDKVIFKDKSGKETSVPADTIITAIGYKPNPLCQAKKHIHIVGDALKVGNLRTVVWKAWEVAEKI